MIENKSALQMIVTIALIGLLCWVVLMWVPMPYPFGQLLVGAGVIVCIVMIVRALGIWPQL